MRTRLRLVIPILAMLLSVFFVATPAATHAATRSLDPQVLALVPAASNTTCHYRLDTTHNGVTTHGVLQSCAPNALHHTVQVAQSVADSHHWSYLSLTPARSSTHPVASLHNGAVGQSGTDTQSQNNAIQSPMLCPSTAMLTRVSPNCGGGGSGGGSPCNYFQNLWTWATFGDGVGFSAYVAYTVDCGNLQLNWSQIGQFGYYGANYTLAFTDYNAFNIGTFWQGIPHGSYSFQGYGKWTSLGGDFVFATYNNNNWGDWDWIDMGHLW